MTVHGAEMVKAFGLDDQTRSRMVDTDSSVNSRANKMAQLKARPNLLMETLGRMSITIVILYAGWGKISSVRMPGKVMSFVTARPLAYEPARRLIGMNVGIAER